MFALGLFLIEERMMKQMVILVVVSLVSLMKVNAEENQSLDSSLIKQHIIQAIADVADAPRKEWAVTITHYENEEGEITSNVERYVPSEDKDKQWHLLKINGENPSDKQREKFIKRKLKHAEEKEQGNSYSINFKTLIKQDSLKVLSENDSLINVGFLVHMEKLGDDAVGKLTGILHFNKKQRFIEEITINNTAQFSPMFSASIDNFALSFFFNKRDEVVLPASIDMRMQGSYAFFKEINEVSTTTYSDYQHVSHLIEQ